MHDDISEIKRLLCEVPKPPGYTLPEGASLAEIQLFEERLGAKLPLQMRELYTISNGPLVGPGGLFGIKPERQSLDVEKRLELVPWFKTKGWLPIAGDGCGNYYACLLRNAAKGLVFFYDSSSGVKEPTFWVASSVRRFLTLLLREELEPHGWPFNKTYMSEHDPDLLGLDAKPLPWS
jgi:cell wall assembly regulator SMI1